MIFDKYNETMGIEQRRALQLKKLQNMVDYCLKNVEFYKQKLSSAGISSGQDIKSLEDIKLIPFTTKSDLQAYYPFGFLAVPINEVARVHASSGSYGKPTMGYYTQKDLDLWGRLAARVLAINGIEKDDIFQISVGYGLFTGALGFHQGAHVLGCTVIPASVGNTERQLVTMRDIGVTAITATPSYAVHLAEKIASEKNLNDYSLKKVLFGAERCSANTRKRVEECLNVVTADNYGLTEFFGPGVGGECAERKGLHISEDVFYPEIIDTESHEVLPDGKMGELVFTSLEREAMPLLRYRTGDLTYMDHEPCACGRTTVRIQAPMGRTDEMFVFKGVNVFPSQIEFAMENVEGISAHYHIRLERKNFCDYATVYIELNKPLKQYKPDQLEKMKETIKYNLKKIVVVRLEIEFVEPNTLERFTGKAKRVSDLRYIDETE